MVAMMWLVIGVSMAYMHKREEGLRANYVRYQLLRISNRILSSYEHNEDLNPFMDFLVNYFDNSIFDALRVSVYDKDGTLLYNIGIPFDLSITEGKQLTPVDTRMAVDSREVDRDLFYMSLRKSQDGQIRVLTGISRSAVEPTLQTDPEFWITVLLLMVIVVFIAYYATGFLMRNVKALSEFAKRASLDQKNDVNKHITFSDLHFPHDELGDISRQIVKFYAEKAEAMRKSEREHRIAIHAVEEKSRIKRQLTNNINHEIKTPIGVIRGYIDTILSTPDMDEDMRTHFLKRAQTNVDRLCSLLNDVSTMTRLEEGSGNIPVSDVNMHDLLFTLENDMEVSQMSGNLQFSFDVPLDCVVKGNSSLLQGMVSNLIKNAALHSHGSKITFKLVHETSKYYTFSFADNGCGVGEEHLSHLFERFYRIDAGRSRKAGGTGLGLPIVKNTVEALGGTISVHNRASGGLEFVFTLEKWHSRS